MALNAMDCARLTGQTIYTMELFRPLRNIYNRARDYTRASISSAGVAWMSKFIYQYHRLMLMNLGPREPATEGWPLYLYPPPHFLVGYQYLIRACNDYVFETRSYSRLKYTEIHLPLQQKMNWTVMANCAYTINVGAYHRFVDLENFEETLAQVQQAVLAERVVADLALITPMRGFGVTNIAGERHVPVERLLQDQYKNLSQCQSQAWGLADRFRIQKAGHKDLVLLTTIKRLKTAFFNFLVTPKNEYTQLSLPCDCMWLEAFLDKFSNPELANFQTIRDLPSQTVTKSIISALSLPRPAPVSLLSGGAFELRPRENGRAVTEEMRRRRGEMIEQFIDRLPVRRRRRRPPPPPSPAVEVEEEKQEEEAPAEAPPAPRSFEEEVRDTVAEAIRLLQEELTVSARNEQFFNFAVDFYEVIQRLEMLGNVNELTIRRWVMYFFVAEHIATTLNYLHHVFRLYPPFARWVDLDLAQVVMRARGEEGQVVYSRVWNEMGEGAFSQVMNRVSGDLAATVERAGLGELQEEELEQFMSDIAYQDNSGDVGEILRQVASNDVDIDSMELSFRFKVTGPVVFTQNRQIQNINRRVVALATQLRLEHRPLPVLHQNVQLPL
ncbi:pTP [Skunk adenovirus 1]|uniref:Preterminal protein n=1 Tax=Skunk adenovirus 1 TaxID=2698728 RepID=A0A0K0MGC8_9ADEN|nr:pTP [Skunk adenovirus PB1]QDF59480.1 pTP [African pygmy hedgehog adenovirus 1]QKF54464.1 pTP [Skunk adenovirus HUN/2009]UKT59810.1 pTP [Raccoon adenovirus]UKT59840.1 pTP [Porcupine adenovirus]AKC34843.1 pTP [Skunk adenovirus PB1]